MNRFFYSASVATGRFIFWQTMRLHLIRPEVTDREGGYILALTHLGNLDPFCSCVLQRRPIWWMARKEFFQFPLCRWYLKRVGAFSVNRQGIPVSSVRRAIALAREGKVVGICPEGGVKRSREAAFRGGEIKKGVCSVAIRSGASVIPCVMLGTPELNRVRPWLPFKNAKLWVAYGEPVPPPHAPSNRAKRELLCGQLSRAYVSLYAELCQQFGLDDAAVP
jgi:1-acyl-sn-glycerol-3-phosphate acyltransferase